MSHWTGAGTSGLAKRRGFTKNKATLQITLPFFFFMVVEPLLTRPFNASTISVAFPSPAWRLQVPFMRLISGASLD